MLSWLTDPNILLGGFLLALVQIVAALPWLRAVDPHGFAQTFRDPQAFGKALGAVVGLGLLACFFIGYKGDSSSFQFYGKIYGAILHLQLLIDLFLIVPQLLILIWPKGGAVALAAYREGWRQPMFWLIAVFGVMLTWLAVFLPYFTFGDDYKMMKQIGFDITMLAAALFGVLAASISISEEIEGRTAITLMSKPVNRRQFLIGKYLGILMACAGMALILGWNLNWALVAKATFDDYDKDRVELAETMSRHATESLRPLVEPFVPTGPAQTLAIGSTMWFGATFAHTLFILLGFGQVMILVAVATALATRLPFVINLVLCLVVYFLGHLAPVVVRVTEQATGGTAGARLVGFLGRLFDTLLPGLDFFNGGAAIIRETPLDLAQFAYYVLTVTGYAVIYTSIALLVGLLLFEDRDLA